MIPNMMETSFQICSVKLKNIWHLHLYVCVCVCVRVCVRVCACVSQYRSHTLSHYSKVSFWSLSRGKQNPSLVRLRVCGQEGHEPRKLSVCHTH